MVNRSTTSSVTSRPRAERRGFSLLELLLALGLVLAIAAIAAPLTFREFTRNESMAAMDRLASQAVLARVEARQTGLPHELMVDVTGRRLTVRPVDPRDPGMISDPQAEEGNPEFGMDQELNGDASSFVPAESWQLLVLPEGVRLEPYRPEDGGLSSDDVFDVFDESEVIAPVDDIDPFIAPTRLAMFMPDGSLLGVRPMMVVRPESRERIGFDPWTGRLLIEPIREEPVFEDVPAEPTS